MKKAWLFLFLQLAFFCVRGQHLEWLHAIEGNIIPNQTPVVIDLAIDNENNSYLLGGFRNKQLGYDDTSIKSTIIKYNEKGDTCWHKNFSYYLTATSADNDSCNLYSLALIDVATKIGNDFYGAPKGRRSLILIKSDSAFNIEWTRLLSDSLFGYISIDSKIRELHNKIFIYIFPSIYLGSGNNPEKAYFLFKNKNYEGKNSLASTRISAAYWLGLEKTKAGSNNEWCSIMYGRRNDMSPSSGLNYSADDLGNLYCVVNGDALFFNDSSVSTSQGSWIVKLSASDGALKDFIKIPGLWEIAVMPNGKICATVFYNTFNYRGISFPGIGSGLLFLKNNGDPIWAIPESNSGSLGYCWMNLIHYRNNNIYISGSIMRGNSGFGGMPLITTDPLNQRGIAIKVDTLGNCLWAYVLNSPSTNQHPNFPYRFEIDYNGNPHFTGWYNGTMAVLDTSVYSPTTQSNTYIYKISDFAIFRGDVYQGPYCAGDTFDIPYTLRGKFNSGNEFIAQLSDEDGNFFGGERELGRLKANKDGVIKGVQPLFNVYSSGKYRIRILSTSPAAQSYYRQDTLRLLIYSRDSANAGPDTTICRGQKIKLKTFGGTRWEWSPAASLDNPAINKPTATPIIDTEYRIIISDSSGCGDTDTDYVWVRVRPPLDISTPFTDTTICRGQAVTLYASTKGGDSLNHIVSWYERKNGKDILIGTGNKFITTTCADSCALQPKTIFAVLNDNCTAKPDTQFYKINVLDALAVDIVTPDTLLCQKQKITITTNAKGGNGKYTIDWYNGTGLITTADSLKLSPALADTYIAILTDNCTIKPDTAKITITLRPPLSLVLDAIDSICQKQPVVLRAKPSGGDTTKHSILWTVDSGPWTAFQNPAIDTPKTTTTYIATLTDNCSPAVKDSIKITVLPTPIADFIINPKAGCPPLRVTFTDNSINNDSIYNQWKILLDEAKGTTTYSRDFITGGIYNIGLQVSNKFGCSDAISRNESITVWQKPRAQFTIKPDIKEADNELQLYNYSQGASKYLWDMGDGNAFYRNSPTDTTYTYKEGGNYPVTLIVENDRGCKDSLVQNFKIFDRLQCFVPNAFTPNGDGINNTFAPVCAGTASYTLTIYNRWGEVVSNCQNCTWDGTHYGTPVTGGAYMYMLRVEAESKKWETIFGVVNVLR